VSVSVSLGIGMIVPWPNDENQWVPTIAIAGEPEKTARTYRDGMPLAPRRPFTRVDAASTLPPGIGGLARHCIGYQRGPA
jgi:hypothetical protein